MTVRRVTYDDVVSARKVVYQHLHRTPLHYSAGLSERFGAEIFLKHENHLPTGAFKVRGGVNLAAGLGSEARAAGLFTASTGNHGQSIAYGGRAAGVPVTVAVPIAANPGKMAAIRELGATVIEHGRDFDEAREWIAERAAEKAAVFVGPTDPPLIAGVGTYALEIFEDLPSPDVILVPVGAGSGASGVCLAAKHGRKGVRVIGVQAQLAPAVQRSWRAGRPVRADMETRAEGLATRVAHPGALELLCDPQTGLDDFVLVADETLDEAVGLLLEHTRNVVEHAGAATLAAVLEHGEELELGGRRVVLVVSGGNLALRDLADIVEARSKSWRGATTR